MRIDGYNWESLNRHGVTVEMIDEVLFGAMVSSFPFQDDRYVEPCEMYVGYTLTERLLEIGIRITSDNSYFVFHAQNVSPYYRQLFTEDWDNG